MRRRLSILLKAVAGRGSACRRLSILLKAVAGRTRVRAWILAAVTATLVCGGICSGCDSVNSNAYTLYYTNSTSTILMEYSYEPKSQGAQALAVEFFNQMKDVSISNAYSVVPSGIECEKVTIDGDVINLYLTGNTDSTTNVERLVFVSSLTKAISQLEEVGGVRIFSGEKNLADGLGEYIDILKPNNFVNNANDDSDDYVTSTLTLYFADEDKDSLVKTTKEVSYKSTTQLERVVVEEIIAGPDEAATLSDGSKLNPTVSEKLILLSVSVQDGVCYVNLSDEFISDPVTSFDQVPVYSIVNSLTELPNINSVQISINGDATASMPKGNISLASTFSFNSELVTH